MILKLRKKVPVQHLFLPLLILITLLCAFPAGLFGSISAQAAEKHVYDKADLLTDEEEEKLEQSCQEFEQKTNMHPLIYTVTTDGSSTVQEIADDFYDACYPSSSDEDGYCIAIDMGQRELAVSTAGIMRYYLSDSEIDQILDDAVRYAGDGDYYNTFACAMKDVEEDVNRGVSEQDYLIDENGKITRYRTITSLEAILAGAAGLLAGGLCFFGIRISYHKRKRKNEIQYSAMHSLKLTNRQDVLIDRHVVTHRIHHDQGGGHGGFGGGHGSSVHMGSSGRSHGGGSRGF